VAGDFREGQRAGITGTPTFVINGRVLAGLQPLEVYESAIEQAEPGGQ
jgi:protein-disulfide isomerase